MTSNKHARKRKVYDNSNYNNNKNNDFLSLLDAGNYIIDDQDQKLLELLVNGYENKKIAAEVKTPLSTIQ